MNHSALSLAMAAAMVMALGTTVAAQDFSVDVTASSLNVRNGVWGSKLGSVRNGQSFVVRAQSQGWYRIDWSGREAWISGSYASRSSRPIVEVTASSLNARSGPSTGNSILVSLPRGQRYVRLDQSGSWLKIQLDSRQAWIHGDYTRAVSGGATPAPSPTPSPTPAPAPGGSDLAGLDVALDTGHGVTGSGDFDPGAVNRFNGIREYDLNREVGFRVRDLLRARGARVSLNTYPSGSVRRSLFQKGTVARGHDLFVSLHHNAFNDSAQGAEVLVHKTKTTSSSIRLAQLIQDRLVQRIFAGQSRYDRGVKRQSLGVLSGAHSQISTAVLVEGFFLDPSNVTRAKADQWVEAEAQAIADGIATYWKTR